MKYIPLVQVCDFQGGSQPPKDQWIDHEKEGYIRMLQIRDFTQPDKDNVEFVRISKTIKTCSEDDILIGRYGASVGKILTGLAGAYNVAIIKTIPDTSKLLKRFLYHYLNSPYFQNFILSVGSRAAQAGFNKDDLSDAKIPDLSVEEQRNVVSQLDKVYELIALRKEQLAKLDELVKARFVELFGDPVANEKSWNTKPLLEMGSCKNGMNFHYEDTGFEINCLGVGDFKDYSTIVDTSVLPTVSLNEMPSDDYLLKDDDIVFVRSNGNKALVGRSVAVYPGAIPTTFSGFCIRYRKTDEAVNIPYLLRVLKAESVRQKMAGRGANIQNLNQQILGTLIIPVPPIELQNQFAAFVKQTDKSKLTVQQSLDTLEVMKKALMQKYFG